MDLKEYIRNVPDFPKKGINFFDITTLLKNEKALRVASDLLFEHYKGLHVNKVVATESRGYILGSILAYKLDAGFIPVRKPGKLPAKTISESYTLEYGSNTIEMHIDAISKDDIVLLHDDLLATGGTMKATCNLVEKMGGKIVGVSFLIELAFLNGRNLLGDYDIFSLMIYDSE
jgi:adenine phosphoribosyltransferase